MHLDLAVRLPGLHALHKGLGEKLLDREDLQQTKNVALIAVRSLKMLLIVATKIQNEGTSPRQCAEIQLLSPAGV